MSEPNPIRVLIADDHALVRRGIVLMLRYEPDMEAVAEAGNGREAVELYRLHRPDVTLMDVRMPEMDGIEAIKAIRGEFPAARLILLTTYEGDEDIYRGLRAGAMAYLLKDIPCEELLTAIRAVHAGHKHITALAGAKMVERAGLGPELSEREREIVRLMARGKTNPEIAATLHVTEGTVKYHVNHILRKLGVSDRTQAVVVALKRGIATLE